MTFDHLRVVYFEESAELLESAYLHLGDLADGRRNDETIHALFRAIHSIKGGGGSFGLKRIVAFAHVMETMMDLVREGALSLTPARLALLVKGTDALADLISAERDGLVVAVDRETALLAAFADVSRGDAPPPAGPPIASGQPPGWRVKFRPHPNLFRTANDPLLLIRELMRLAPTTVAVDLSSLPALDCLEPEDSFLAWTIDVGSELTRAQIIDVFEFVADDSMLEIEPMVAPVIAPQEVEAAPAEQHESRAAPAETGNAGRPETATAAPHSVRVDVVKVDRLVNLVGELVINQAMLLQLGGTLPPDLCPGLMVGLGTLSQHLRELQEAVMAIRTQPVKSVFSRMPRLIRDLSAQLDKDVQLVITGEDTEIDKTVVEQLADPLTHLLRNAVDHGIETPEHRIAAGKAGRGTIHLGAEQRAGRIFIAVSDDGRGIDRVRVLARARERGLVAPDATPTDSEIDELIFLPSFSTAAIVSDISGRGVGMDVVRRNIQALGGRIAIESRSGTGSRFLLSLPLTLAVLDGLVVSVGREAYVLPLSAIVESLRPSRSDIHSIVGRGDVLAIRGVFIPLLPLHQQFDVTAAKTDPTQGIVVIVEIDAGEKIGLLVDDLLGQQQVVVKSLEENYRSVAGIGGATILGDGRVALILDVTGLRAETAVPSMMAS
ncbi:chemotaxis protein CheA [Lichenicola sp.]|uniref:chemotaxis protein CheA n=1 Tax=Lichenicola sp. TaxID=2804529 RepID=UPI003AFF8DF7